MNAEEWKRKGDAHFGQGQWAEAVDAFRQAQVLRPDSPEVAFKLGVSLHEQGLLDQAADCYRRVLTVMPGLAEAGNALATSLKEQGHLEEAIAQFRETLRLHPDYALAYYGLSKFAAEGRYTFTPAELDRIQSLLASERLSAMDRSLCAFTLAAVLHQQGAYDEAFAYYKTANDLRKQVNQKRGLIFDARAHADLIDRIIATYDAAYFAGVKSWGNATELPVFIVGMPRSGSTLVEQILASHAQVVGAGETGDVPMFIARFVVAASPRLYTAPLLSGANAAKDLAAEYLGLMGRFAKGRARLTIKTLQNYMHLGLIATLFPRAHIIHCRRDPLDVCLSCYFTNFQNIDFASSLEDIGAYYRGYERLMAHWSKVLSVPIHEVCYENLIHDQESVSREMIAYCGLEWDERCLTFFNTRRAVQTASSVQVRKPISNKALGRWRHYRAHLGPLFQALGRSAD